MTKLRAFLGALKILITRRTEWACVQPCGSPECDHQTEVMRHSLAGAWRIVGWHSYQWGWVRRYGRLDCGCLINPITRRRLLHVWRCPVHWNPADLELLDGLDAADRAFQAELEALLAEEGPP